MKSIKNMNYEIGGYYKLKGINGVEVLLRLKSYKDKTFDFLNLNGSNDITINNDNFTKAEFDHTHLKNLDFENGKLSNICYSPCVKINGEEFEYCGSFLYTKKYSVMMYTYSQNIKNIVYKTETVCSAEVEKLTTYLIEELGITNTIEELFTKLEFYEVCFSRQEKDELVCEMYGIEKVVA